MIRINNKCIGCGTCQSVCDTVFKVAGIPAVVIKQPETPEEKSLCQQAIDMCPVQAIYDDQAAKIDTAPMKMAA